LETEIALLETDLLFERNNHHWKTSYWASRWLQVKTRWNAQKLPNTYIPWC